MLIFIPFALRTQALLTLDSKSVGQIIQSYAQTKELNSGKELHSLLIRSRSPLCTSFTNHLINLYSKCGVIVYAQNLFDKMPLRNLVSWTTMITAFSQNSRHPQALRAFSLMRASSSESPTQFALASAVRACVSLKTVRAGKQLHCLALKSGLGSDPFVGTNLSYMYSKCGDISDTCKFFDEIPSKDAVSWTAMIDGYSKNGDFESALEAFNGMRGEVTNAIDPHVLSSTLSACASINAHEFGKCLQSIVMKLGFESELAVSDTLVNMYLGLGDVESASKVLLVLSGHEGYIVRRFGEMGRADEALAAFVRLRRQGIEPKESTLASLIKACADRDSLGRGVQVQAQVVKLGLGSCPHVRSRLVSMYGKCGSFDQSTRMIDEIGNPSETDWNSFLNAFGTFDDLVLLLKPNETTSNNLLMLCSGVGLVDEGLKYLSSMERRFGVKPTKEHCNRVVDLLSRAGRLEEAEEFMKNMQFEANGFGLTSYLGACRVRGDAERVKFAAENMLKLEPDNTEALVVLSNLCAKEQRWKELRILKKRLRNKLHFLDK